MRYVELISTTLSGDEELDSKYKEVMAARDIADANKRDLKRVYDKIRKLGIKSIKLPAKYLAENCKVVEIDPAYKQAYARSKKANKKYADITLEFKKMYDKYRKNGGKQIRDYYIAAHEWDDELKKLL